MQVVQIGQAVIDRFVQVHLLTCHCSPRCQRSVKTVRAATTFWLGVARSCGLVKQAPDNIAPLVRNELIAFRYYLTEIRGLQLCTCNTRVKHVSDFLVSLFSDQTVSIDHLKPVDIVNYMSIRTKTYKPGTCKVVCGALSSYLRFKAINGTSTTKLIAALPKVAQWQKASLPKALSSDDIDTVLSSFDLCTSGGQRDYAIARCYIDLGLRTAEVARLNLEDIDWHQGVVFIRSKGARIDVLPLPKATGQAIANYLEHRDSKHVTRALFLRLRPPFDRAATAETIRASIRNAAKRCGLSSILTGPHKLRHTLAVRLVNSGVSLKEISDLMRHRDLDTTTIYAKVDMDALTAVSSAWPEKSS